MDFNEQLNLQRGKGVELLKKHTKELVSFRKNYDNMLAKISKDVDEFRRTGKIPCFTEDQSSDSDDLAVAVQVKKEVESPKKPTRRALKETQTVQQIVESKLDGSIHVKKEKATDELPRRETLENMPPPPPPSQTTVIKKHIKQENMRSTRTRTRKLKELEEQNQERKDSDVIIQNATIVTIDLSSDDEKPQKNERSTRTKTRAAAKLAAASAETTKRNRSASEDSNHSKSSRTKNNKKKKPSDQKKDELYCEDAVTNTVKPQIVTNNILDATHTIVSDLKDIMTDDESPRNSDVPTKDKNTKQIFSPYEQSPVKKKVAAFEKLGAAACSSSVETMKQTRLATKTLAKDKNGVNAALLSTATTTESVKSKSKVTTPLSTTRFMPSHVSTTCSKLKKPSLVDHSPIPKSFSAIKASAADFRERELKRQKESEALQKRNALLQAQVEEKRRKRAEKQLKAQQIREANEKDKQRHLEMMEKLKEEKIKQHLAEKDMKLQKQKEELERKRELAKQRAAEERKDFELPIYMVTKAPLLQTPDCYDSDSEEAPKKPVFPEWTKGNQLRNTLKIQDTLPSQLKNTFFCVTPQTVDLTQVFQGIDPRKLKRTSSAVWTKPPRFTLMSFQNNSLDVTKEEDE